MISLMFDWLQWRTSRRRVRSHATRLLQGHGEKAFFHAQNCAWYANERGQRAQARFWEAVGGEVSRQIQRQAIMTRIMAPRSASQRSPETAEPANHIDPPLAHTDNQRPIRRDHLYLVHYRPAAEFPHGSSGRRERRRGGPRPLSGVDRPLRQG